VSGAAANSGARALDGKHAIVTGGSRGIGAAIARVLLDHGARVTLLGRTEAETAPAKSANSNYIRTDVTDAGSVAKALDAARARYGATLILVNNAGQAASAPFLKTDPKLWRQMMAVNLDGTFHCSQAALPDMLAAGWGRIVNIASIAGLIGQAYVTAYCASKHGAIGLTRALALEVATKGVTVNAVCPGFTDTDMVAQAAVNISAKTGRTPEHVRAELAARNPQKRLVTPEEVANAVAWLCLPGSESVTGQAITVAGGEVM